MFTLMIMPVFEGTRKETIKALLLTLMLDAIYLVPMLTNHS
jgi:hypothetical protein